MINFMYMIRDVICSQFEKQIGRWQGQFGTDGKPTERKALIVYFRISKKGTNKTDKVKMLIHAPANYVGVYIQKEEKKWECIGYHDSCWRNSIQDFLYKNSENIHFDSVFKTNFIVETKLTEDELKTFRQIRNKKYN